AGIKMHTLYEIQTDIPTFIHITEAKVHDQRAMDEIPYEQVAYYPVMASMPQWELPHTKFKQHHRTSWRT
ncbi:MAG: hypothetical protein II404_11135, partial [Prevotella sp.]|nr:hypothetical protein [Prevotella sp.]